jgi:hypothetical protein
MSNSIQPSSNRGVIPAVTSNLLSEVNKTEAIKANPYTTRIDSSNPTAFVFLVDQSYSMSEEVTNGPKAYTKAEAVAESMNAMLNELMNRCTKANFFKHYFDVALIGYGAEKDKCGFIFGGQLQGKTFVTPQELNDFAEIEEAESTQFVRGKPILRKTVRKFWVKPKTEQNTPMIGAVNLATEILQEWISQHKRAYPPVVINITDGAQTDGEDNDLLDAANKLKSLHTEDGHVLFFNIHLGDNGTESISFPCRRKEIPDDKYAQLLFDMSSDLPDIYHKEIAALKQSDNMHAYRAIGYNMDISDFISMLNIGTITNINKNA